MLCFYEKVYYVPVDAIEYGVSECVQQKIMLAVHMNAARLILPIILQHAVPAVALVVECS
jgi:hypothetical protein